MKKILYSVFALAMATFTLTSCEDVPMPYDDPNSSEGGSGGGGTVVVEPTGQGTVDDPYNSVAANNVAAQLASGEESDIIYIKGKVVSIKEQYGTQYGNATFYISDDGTENNQFYVYRALYLGNVKYSSGDLIKEGDDVVICGKVTNYMGNTYETVQGAAYLYSLNGNVSGGETGGGEVSGATGDGTEANPFNSIAANNFALSLAANAVSENAFYVKGKVVSVKEQYGTQYGNASFYISDDGTADNQFYVYRALYLNNEKYTSGTLLQPGDDVVICGKLTNYMGNTPETAQGEAYLVSLKSNGGGDTGGGSTGGEDITGNSITVNAADLGLDNATAVTNLTLSDGTTLSFEGGGSTNVPKYYTTGTCIRMYPKNSMTVTASKQIQKIIFIVDQYNNIYNASGDITANPGSVTTNDTNVTISDVNNKTTIITNVSTTTGAPSQLRIKTITIVYAD